MKNLAISILTILLTVNIAVSQKTANYNDVVTKKVKGVIDTYVSKNGEEFSVGDTLTLGSAFRNEQFDYIQQNAGIAVYPLPNTASGSMSALV